MGVAILFPGQGTQSAGMGGPWKTTPWWALIQRAEAALGEPLAFLLLDAPTEALSRTREAQLAVFLHSLVAWEAVREAFDSQPPVAFAGHSLGQLTALVASGALSLEDGIRLVARRAAATQASADRRPGRMAALMGADPEVAEAACAAVDEAWVANDNAPGQIVVGGTPAGVEAAGAAAKALGVRRVIPLNVGGAFHTPLFADARAELEPVLAATRFSTPVAPVVSNVDAAAHVDPSIWPAMLGEHLVSPVRWRQSVLTLVSLGADSFVEIGPGNVLAGLARRTAPDVTVRNVAFPDDVAPFLTPVEVC
ncbi:MAG TPA: ACP S-malonyltransferase [Acidimicrobiales bacterium]